VGRDQEYKRHGTLSLLAGINLLRGIRVHSKQELRARIELYLQEVNEEPVVFKWKYKLETLPAESVVP
jgi:hypothetical protein